MTHECQAVTKLGSPGLWNLGSLGFFVEGATVSAAGSTCSVSLEPALRCLQAVSVFVESEHGYVDEVLGGLIAYMRKQQKCLRTQCGVPRCKREKKGCRVDMVSVPTQHA